MKITQIVFVYLSLVAAFPASGNKKASKLSTTVDNVINGVTGTVAGVAEKAVGTIHDTLDKVDGLDLIPKLY